MKPYKSAFCYAHASGDGWPLGAAPLQLLSLETDYRLQPAGEPGRTRKSTR